MTRFHALFTLGLQAAILCGTFGPPLVAQETTDALEAIRGVSHQAEGNIAAKQAYQFLVRQDRSVLPQVLEAFDEANPLTENYLRSAFEVITTNGEGDVPIKELEAYLANLKHNQKARGMVFEFLSKHNPDKTNEMLEGMLDDPSAGIRFLAVQKVVKAAKKFEENSQPQKAIAAYRRALQSASVADQVQTIEAALKKAGVEVDLRQHFGLLTDWRIIGPFDNTDMKSFDVVYPPEKELDFSARYDGKEGKVSWQTIGFSEKAKDSDLVGSVDIAKSIAPHKGAVMYMYTEYVSSKDQDVFVRMATSNAWKLWVNDELVFAREEYHRGMRWDQYRVPLPLRKGNNQLLLKILQNEQDQSWAQDYSVQFRITDASGKALLSSKSYDPAK